MCRLQKSNQATSALRTLHVNRNHILKEMYFIEFSSHIFQQSVVYHVVGFSITAVCYYATIQAAPKFLRNRSLQWLATPCYCCCLRYCHSSLTTLSCRCGCSGPVGRLPSEAVASRRSSLSVLNQARDDRIFSNRLDGRSLPPAMIYSPSIVLAVFALLPSQAFSSCVSSDAQKTAFCGLWGGFTSNGFSIPSGMDWACTYPAPGQPLQPVGEPCNWAGVACDPVCNAVALNLGRAGISGTLSPYIGQLTALQGLYIYENNINGGLPAEIAYLTNLEALCIDNNHFTGAFPKVTFYGSYSTYLNNPPMPGRMIGLTQLSLLTADYNNFDCISKVFTKTESRVGLFDLSWNDVYFDPNLPICGRKSLRRIFTPL